MKSIEKSLTSFLNGNGPSVSKEELCLYAAKNKKQANEIIDILFSAINNYIDTYTGSTNLEKVRDLLRCVVTLMKENENVDKGIVGRKLQKLDYKLEHIQAEHKKMFTNYERAVRELETTKDEVYLVVDSTVNGEEDEYEYIDIITNEIKNISLFELTSSRLPKIINAKDKEKNSLFKNMLINYFNSVIKENEKDILYYTDILYIIMNHKEFNLSKNEKQECSDLIFAYMNRLSSTKKNKKKNMPHIDFLNKIIATIRGEEQEKDIKTLSRKYSISIEFKPEIYDDARLAKIPKEGKIIGREEVDDYIITMDKPQSVELDDGLSCTKLENGNYLLGVHIASPLAYFSYDSDIVQEALSRSQSLYLPHKYQDKENEYNRVIPIFPYDFSAKNASLVPDAKRFARSYYFEIDGFGNIVNEEFKKTIITSKKRTSYREIDSIIEKGSNDRELDKLVENLLVVTSILDKKYKANELYEKISEIKEDFSDDNIKSTGSENIVNKAVILTGNRVAEFFSKNGYPCLYKVHKVNQSDMEKIETLINNLTKHYGFSARDKLFKLLGERKGMYPQSYYDIEGPHVGLGLEHYCQCTSPLRRAPDIVVEHALEICYDNTPSDEELRLLEKEVDERHTLFNNKQNSIEWFTKDYKSCQKRRR